MFPETPPSGRERRRRRKQKTLVPPPRHISGWRGWLARLLDNRQHRSPVDTEAWQRMGRSPHPPENSTPSFPGIGVTKSSADSSPSQLVQSILPWLDSLVFALWGFLFLKFWLTGKLYLLIHPNYQGLTITGGIGLVALGLLRLISTLGTLRASQDKRAATSSQQHLSLLPSGVSHTLLLVTAILGLVIEPRAFASQTAIQRGVTDTLALTRVRPQAFRSVTRSEDKSIVDWVRTLNAYPEPDAYTGQKVKVQGFVVHPEDLPENYLLISRFVITCCAADVYPVGLPVKLTESRMSYPPDAWFEVEGEMITDQPMGKRQLTIQANRLQTIPEPENPYDF